MQRHGTANSFVPNNAINLLQLSQRLLSPEGFIDLLPEADTNSSQTSVTLIVISNIHSKSSSNHSTVHSVPGIEMTTTAGIQVHFPFFFTRQYSLAMYTRCIH